MSSPGPRLVHLHIPKTAGTAIRVALQKAANNRLSLFPHYEERFFLDVNPEDYNFYSGHFGYETALRLGGNIVTVLRDPVDRFVSVYYFWRQLYTDGTERNRKTALAANYSLEDFAKLKDEPFLAEEFFNRATWQIAFGSSLQHRQKKHAEGVVDGELLDTALKNLRTFAVVGFQDNIQPFNNAVGRLVGVNLSVTRANVTRDRLASAEIPNHTRDIIESWVYLDIELLKSARVIEMSNAISHSEEALSRRLQID